MASEVRIFFKEYPLDTYYSDPPRILYRRNLNLHKTVLASVEDLGRKITVIENDLIAEAILQAEVIIVTRKC